MPKQQFLSDAKQKIRDYLISHNITQSSTPESFSHFYNNSIFPLQFWFTDIDLPLKAPLSNDQVERFQREYAELRDDAVAKMVASYEKIEPSDSEITFRDEGQRTHTIQRSNLQRHFLNAASLVGLDYAFQQLGIRIPKKSQEPQR